MAGYYGSNSSTERAKSLSKESEMVMLTDNGVDLPTKFVLYAIIGVLLMVITLIVKLLWNLDGDDSGPRNTRPTENSRLLLSKEEILFDSPNYGTSSEDDLESGEGSCSSSWDDLYDAKICVICYDHQRNCFFIPCGHCVSCFNCSKRIMSEEIKSCPICRTFITKVTKVHIL